MHREPVVFDFALLLVDCRANSRRQIFREKTIVLSNELLFLAFVAIKKTNDEQDHDCSQTANEKRIICQTLPSFCSGLLFKSSEQMWTYSFEWYDKSPQEHIEEKGDIFFIIFWFQSNEIHWTVRWKEGDPEDRTIRTCSDKMNVFRLCKVLVLHRWLSSRQTFVGTATHCLQRNR